MSILDVEATLIEAPILLSPNWDLPLEIMSDTPDYALRVFLGQQVEKKAHVICYVSKTCVDAQMHYTATKKELLEVFYAL